MIFKAIEFAARAHAGQYRKKTKIPYITHPLQVAEILIEHGSPENAVIAAVLHDTIEDSGTTVAEIKNLFGGQIAQLVQNVTEPEKKLPWEYRKQHTIESIAGLPLEAVLVLCADKLHNLRSIRLDIEKQGESVWQRFSRPKEKQQWYFRAILTEFKKRSDTQKFPALLALFENEVQELFGEKTEA
jgi:(p)ppGpp synthase/HD superfamily hydrolase